MLQMYRKNGCYKYSKQLLLCMKTNGELRCFSYKRKSHYKSLDLNSDANSKQIKDAYYKLSMKYHPDKNQGNSESVEKFREISEAYEVLGNAEKKRKYDSDINSRYSEAEWRDQNYSPRSRDFKNHSSSRTGRSQYYDYDEHYRQHYEEYNRRRQANYDYFRYRWEADYRRRNPFADENEWKQYQYRRPQPPLRFKWKIILANKAFIYFMTIWLFMSVFFPLVDMDNPKEKSPKTLYYKVNPDKKMESKEVDK